MSNRHHCYLSILLCLLTIPGAVQRQFWSISGDLPDVRREPNRFHWFSFRGCGCIYAYPMPKVGLSSWYHTCDCWIPGGGLWYRWSSRSRYVFRLLLYRFCLSAATRVYLRGLSRLRFECIRWRPYSLWSRSARIDDGVGRNRLELIISNFFDELNLIFRVDFFDSFICYRFGFFLRFDFLVLGLSIVFFRDVYDIRRQFLNAVFYVSKYECV